MNPTPAAPAIHRSAPCVGLLLTGGGARAAYQIGVLEAVAQLRRTAGGTGNPFSVITGNSAGAINAAALACGADDFDTTVRTLVQAWREVRIDQVYRTDLFAMLDAAARWRLILGIGQLIARWFRLKPRSLLDNSPLAELLMQWVPLERLPRLMQEGHLQALAVTASSYSSGEHITFFESREKMTPWVRSRRKAVEDRITHAHLLASAAIPFIFPAVALPMGEHTEYFGDGSVRQTAPIAAAIHLGATRVLAVGASRIEEPTDAAAPNTFSGEPTLAQIAGHALSGIFLDALAVDMERLQRINQTLSLIPASALSGTHLRQIELLVISPSRRVDEIAARHIDKLPRAVQRLLASGTTAREAHVNIKGAELASYLLFDAAFTGELMALGHADTLSRHDEVCRFFDWPVT